MPFVVLRKKKLSIPKECRKKDQEYEKRKEQESFLISGMNAKMEFKIAFTPD